MKMISLVQVYFFSCAVFLWGALQPAVAASESGSSFYMGKTLKIVVAASPGGGFDTFARLLARHIGRHIPGHPKTIVLNMPGAGHLLAANKFYAMQPGDGLTILNFHFGKVSQFYAGDPLVRFDPLKYVWLGDPTIGSLPEILWVRGDLPIYSLKDLKKRKKPLALGVTGIGNSAAVAGEFLRYLGLPVRNIIGYKGSAETFAAIERKELDGRMIGQSSVQMIFHRFYDEGLIRPIIAVGDEPRLKPIPGVATLEDLKLNPDQRKLAEFVTSTFALLRTYAVPPGTPPERVKILRGAFMKSFKDPQLLKDAKRMGVIVAPVSGEQVTKVIQKMSQTSPEVLKQFRRFIGMK
jgi:tripartite-type tricarboxylate transporter receptor subunit TctC